MSKLSSHQSVIIFVRGLPGSGKTYLTTQLATGIAGEVTILDPDATDYQSKEYKLHEVELKKQGVDPTLFAYRFLRRQAYRAIEEGTTVIWNQPFTNLAIFNKIVNRLKEHAKKSSIILKIVVVEVEVPIGLAKKRIETRKENGGHGPSSDSFNKFVADYKSFASEALTTLTVSGEDISKSLATVKDTLADLAN